MRYFANFSPWRFFFLLAVIASALPGCAGSGTVTRAGVVELPLQIGWFAGERVFYVTTDISDAGMAADNGANHVPRLADALPPPGSAPGSPSAVERIYKVTNFDQGTVLPSVPMPVGAANRDTAYSPLWVLVMVTWKSGASPRELRSEEQVLEAEERGLVTVQRTRIVVNCPVVMTERGGRLRGVVVRE
jgi:hypothetical protein